MAEWVYRKGTKETIYASTLTKSEANLSEYSCGGVGADGAICGIKMKFCFRRDGNHYFKADGGKHIALCPNDESSDKIRIPHMDLSGRDFNARDFLTVMPRISDEDEGTSERKSENGSAGDAPDVGDEDKDIECVKRKPKGLLSLYIALKKNDKDYLFGNKKVKDLIFDRRTHEIHRSRVINNVVRYKAQERWCSLP